MGSYPPLYGQMLENMYRDFIVILKKVKKNSPDRVTHNWNSHLIDYQKRKKKKEKKEKKR